MSQQLASDDFDRADGAIGANWTSVPGFLNSITIVSLAAIQNDTLGASVYSAYSPWPADQYAEVILGTVSTTSDEGVGPAVRCSTGATTLYISQANTTQTRLYKQVAGGGFTQLGSDGAAGAAGNVIRLTVTGTSLTVTKNGSAIVGPVTDASIASGSSGMWLTRVGIGQAASWTGGGPDTYLMGQARQMFAMGLGA